MFNFISAFFQKIGVAVGATFIAIGGVLGGTPTAAPDNIPAPEEVIETREEFVALPAVQTPEKKVASVATKQTEPTVIQQSNQPQTVIPQVPETKVVSTLQITNVKSSVYSNSARVSWRTSTAVRSQLLLDNGNGKGYESLNGVGTSHQIIIQSPEPSKEYNFKIVARTTDGKLSDDYYGSFTGLRIYSASFKASGGACLTIHIQDSVGKPAVNMRITATGSYGQDGNFLQPMFTDKTDSNGDITSWPHCTAPNQTLRLLGDGLDFVIKSGK